MWISFAISREQAPASRDISGGQINVGRPWEDTDEFREHVRQEVAKKYPGWTLRGFCPAVSEPKKEVLRAQPGV